MEETSFEIDKDFGSEQEAMASVDEIMMEIANDISGDETGTSVIIPERARRIGIVYRSLLVIAKGKNVDVTYEMNVPYTSMGSVSVNGKEIIITNPAMFAKIAEMASNFEVYPKTDGTVQMNFTFHNITRRVGG